MKLTLKQKRFADYYIELGNPGEAAIKAGYSERSASVIASENLTKPDIKKYIDERLSQLEDERIASMGEVMKYLTAVMRGDHEEECVVVEGQGDGISEARTVQKKVTPKDRLKAAELLGKRYGMFTDRVNFEGSLPVVITGEDELES